MTNDPTASALRGLYAAHEHLADPAVPEQIATAVRTGRRPRRSWLSVRPWAAVAFGSAAVVAVAFAVAVALRPGPTTTAQVGSATATGPLAAEVAGRLAEVDRLVAATPQSLPLVPVEPVVQVGDWEGSVGENNKLALLSGAVDLGGAVLPTAPTTGSAAGPDGTRHTVPILSARDAAATLARRTQDCGGCTPLRVTTVRLDSLAVRGSGGTWTVPAWSFGFTGTAVRGAVVALAPAQRLDVPQRSVPAAVRVESATASADGRTGGP